MTICDVCESRGPTKKANLEIDTPRKEDCSNTTFDLCEDCKKYVTSNAILAGMKELHRQDKDKTSNSERLKSKLLEEAGKAGMKLPWLEDRHNVP